MSPHLLIFITIFIYISYFHVKTLSDDKLSYIGETFANGYRLFSDLYFLFIYCLIPPSLMLLFGCLTIQNVRLSKRQIIPTNTRIQRRNKQLIRMLLVQIITFIPLTLSVGIRKLYTLFIAGYMKSALTLANDDFAHSFLIIESIIYHS